MGRRLDGDSGMKKSEGDRLKCVVYESTLSTAGAASPSPMGKATIREHRYQRTQPSLMGNAIKLSGRTFLAPHRGSSPKG